MTLSLPTAPCHLQTAPEPTDAEAYHASFTYYFTLKALQTSKIAKLCPDETFDDLADKAEEVYESLPESDPRRAHFLAELYLARAFLLIRGGSHLQGAWQVRKSIIALEAFPGQFPAYTRHLPIYGLMEGLLQSVPDKYRWMLPLVGLSAGKKQGRTIMQEGLKQARQTDALKAQLLLALADTYLYNHPDAATSRLDSLIQSDPGLDMARYLLIPLYLKAFDAKNALKHIRYMEQKAPDKAAALPMFWYMKGEALLRKGDFPQAVEAYSRFLEQHAGPYMVKDAYFKTGIAHYLTGHMALMQEAFEKVREVGSAETDADKYALKVAEKDTELPPPYLYEARLKTDGGYLKEAAAILNARNLPKNQDERTELAYRRARVAHLLNDTTEALSLYKETIRIQNGDEYYAPNACLQSGYLLMQTDPEQARAFFRQALRYKNHPYETSIEQKAKAALKELP